MFFFGLFLGASVLRDLMEEAPDAYGLQMHKSYDWHSGGFGIRGTPLGWRDANPHFGQVDHYGVATGAAGIRGMPTFTSFSPAQIAAYNREGAAQGLRSSSVFVS